MDGWIIAVSAACAATGTLALLVWFVLRTRGPRFGGPGKGAAFELVCRVCNRDLVFGPSELVALSPVERALSVRAKPELVGHPLAEYVCPYCEAAHCYVTDEKPPRYAGTNLYQPQAGGARCMECGRELRAAPPSVTEVDFAAGGTTGLSEDCGLVCERCHAVCCVRCCEKTTRGRSLDGNLACPRCFRQPIREVFRLG